MKLSISRLALLAGLGLCSTSVVLAAAPQYKIVDLGPVPEEGIGGVAWGVNDSSQVVGELYLTYGGPHAVLWEDGVRSDLGALVPPADFTNSAKAYAINRYGAVTGTSQTYLASAQNPWGLFDGPFLYRNGVMEDLTPYLPTDRNYLFAYGNDINDRGQVAIVAQNDLGTTESFLYNNGTMMEMGDVGGNYTWVNAVNNLGMAVGESTDAEGNAHGFLYTGGRIFDMGIPNGYNRTTLSDINDIGVAVGSVMETQMSEWGFPYVVRSRAAICFLGIWIDLGTIGEGQSQATAINNRLDVVGVVDSITPFLYTRGQMYDFNTLVTDNPTGLQYFQPKRINNKGVIVGQAQSPEFGSHAFMAIPVR